MKKLTVLGYVHVFDSYIVALLFVSAQHNFTKAALTQRANQLVIVDDIVISVWLAFESQLQAYRSTRCTEFRQGLCKRRRLLKFGALCDCRV